MSNESSGASPVPPDAPPQPIRDVDLLEDLRNLIVSEESESIRTLGSIVSSLQAKVDDRQGLVELLKPVIVAVLKEKADEDPDALRAVLGPIVADCIREGSVPPPRPWGVATRFRRAVRRARNRVRGLFALEPPAAREPLVEETPPARAEPEVTDAEFGIRELFLLARPSLVLLAHGAWRSPRDTMPPEEQLLPLIRRFIAAKAEKGALDEQVRARFAREHILIESAKHASLVVLYEGTPPVGFFLDAHQAAADLHARFADGLRRAQALPAYRGILRLLLDRYRPAASRLGPQTHEDPLTWPLPRVDALVDAAREPDPSTR